MEVLEVCEISADTFGVREKISKKTTQTPEPQPCDPSAMENAKLAQAV